MLLQAMCIISSSYVNSNWSYSPETVKVGCDLCGLDLWPWPFTCSLPWSLVITFEISWWYDDGNILKKARQIWGIWKLRPAYSPETPNLGQNRWCFVPCDLEIWWMTLENNRAPLFCCFKLCAIFHSHRWIQTGVAVRKHPIWDKFDDF